MISAEDLLGKMDWTAVFEALEASGTAQLRVDSTSNGAVLTLLPTTQHAEGLHCATCQCNKFPPTLPVPGSLRSRSWHQNALTEPPK